MIEIDLLGKEQGMKFGRAAPSLIASVSAFSASWAEGAPKRAEGAQEIRAGAVRRGS
jgi:hypothetical protein